MKAIGSLSEVRHLPAGEVIFRPGEPPTTLFIINRGAVDLFDDADDPRPENAVTCTRGDILADVEVLTGTEHTQLARCREEVSLRCFPAEAFPELLQRVPAFFRFLSEHLAERCLAARETDITAGASPNLAGSLGDFDLVTVYQTITSSLQTGELSILDDNGDVVAAFYFEKGQPRSGQFQHLVGEAALRQLFLLQNAHGTFLFTAARGVTATIKGGSITRHPADLLISALQDRDELQELRHKLGDASAIVVRQKSTLTLQESSQIDDELAEQVWALTTGREPSLADLYPQLGVTEFAIYEVVDELVKSGHLALVTADQAKKVA
jgi:hypothetical protein